MTPIDSSGYSATAVRFSKYGSWFSSLTALLCLLAGLAPIRFDLLLLYRLVDCLFRLQLAYKSFGHRIRTVVDELFNLLPCKIIIELSYNQRSSLLIFFEMSDDKQSLMNILSRCGTILLYICQF
jgi:hypothetical protein